MSEVANQQSQTPGAAAYDRILVPLDGSEAAESAVAFAAQIPCRELCLLYVDTDDDVFVPEWMTNPGATQEDQPVRVELDRIANSLRKSGHQIEILVETGDVAERIIDVATDADLIVMTTRGRGAAGRLFFGSVADRVVRHGSTPTLLLRAGDHTEALPLPTRVVVPLDGSGKSEQTLPVATRIARARAMPILLLRAVGLDEIRVTLRRIRPAGQAPHEFSPDLYEQARQATIEEATAYLDEHVERLRAEGLDAKREVVEGDAAFSLLEAITPDDLVVMTTHGHSGYKRWAIGSVAEKLVRQAPCPVLLQRLKNGSSGKR